ncbi:MAG: IS110 family transposase [Actinomycetota bacterium]|nr:IS110 family transposase [Actinomycetota bacterium]
MREACREARPCSVRCHQQSLSDPVLSSNETESIIMTEDSQLIVGGVDTHKDEHVAVALDAAGRRVGVATFPATTDGYVALRTWLVAFGGVLAVGVEGCGSYGLGLCRELTAAGIAVQEVCRPNRQLRRRRGKSDAVDAEAAARTVLAGHDVITPKSADGPVETMRALRLARRSAIKARDTATNQLHALIVTAPSELRERLNGLPIAHVVQRLVDDTLHVDDADDGYGLAMLSLARRWRQLDAEADDLRAALQRVVADAAPDGLLEQQGVGPDVAAALMIAAGDNPDRVRSEASFAALCGVSPLDASSGKQQRHRLNRGGNRDANMALWRIVLVRLRWDPVTRAYLDRRVSEGKTRREAMRCLKRYIAREIYHQLPRHPLSALTDP